jgi:hydroxyacylglutathione hydrolase
MIVEQIYTGCLAQGAYYIESNGEAAVIDPLRESSPYIQKAQTNGAKIKYIFETHFHADFVSGHLDLAKKTGATIIYGPEANTEYDIYNAKDGQEFELGDIRIKTIHTPGHTLESTTWLLIDENGKEHCVFSGDTLFIGDVGRPDLAIKNGLSQDDLAGMLYDSLRKKIMTLPDSVIVYPAHGAGSACGKNMSKETHDDLGHQKQTNYALRSDMTREEFITELTTGILPAPQYFAKNAMINKTGYESLDAIVARGGRAFDAVEFEKAVNAEEALVLDTRSAADFVAGHIPNSIFIGIDGGFAPWVGALITDINTPIMFIAPEGREEEVITRLSRVGYDNTLGYLKGGIESWKAAGKEISTMESITASKFIERQSTEKAVVLDVRKPGEYATEHFDNAQTCPLDFINEKMNEVDKDTKYFVHCAGGYRSVIFMSILKARGYENMINVEGGWSAIKAQLHEA